MKTGIDTIWEDRKRILGMPISFTKYYLSEDRLFVQTGLLSMKIEETLLYRVTDISARVGLFQRISVSARSSSTRPTRARPTLRS